MSVENGYCTVQQVRDELSDSGSQLSTALLEKAVSATSRGIDRWTGRRFWRDAEPSTRTYRPRSCELARVDDVSTTAGLVVETSTVAGWSSGTAWTLGTDFELRPENADADGGAYAWWQIAAVGARAFPVGYRYTTLRVTARWGWSDVPDEVNAAAVLRAVAIFKRKEAPYGVADFGEFGPVRITRTDPDVMDLLRPFQRVMVA